MTVMIIVAIIIMMIIFILMMILINMSAYNLEIISTIVNFRSNWYNYNNLLNGSLGGVRIYLFIYPNHNCNSLVIQHWHINYCDIYPIFQPCFLPSLEGYFIYHTLLPLVYVLSTYNQSLPLGTFGDLLEAFFSLQPTMWFSYSWVFP